MYKLIKRTTQFAVFSKDEGRVFHVWDLYKDGELLTPAIGLSIAKRIMGEA